MSMTKSSFIKWGDVNIASVSDNQSYSAGDYVYANVLNTILYQTSIVTKAIINVLASGIGTSSGATYTLSEVENAVKAGLDGLITFSQTTGTGGSVVINATIAGQTSKSVATISSVPTATTATNIAGGTSIALLYQAAPGGTTSFPKGTAGQVLGMNANANGFSWLNQSGLTAMTIAGGAAGKLLYQSATGATAFLDTPGASGRVLRSSGSTTFDWSTLDTLLGLSTADVGLVTRTGGNTYSTVATSTYLTPSDAATTYLTKTDAAATYLTSAAAGTTYLTKTDAGTTYLTQTSAGTTYLTKTDAGTTYLAKTDAGTTYLTKTGTAADSSKLNNQAASYYLNTDNRTTTINSSSTDTQVPSAKAVYDTMMLKNFLGVTTISGTPGTGKRLFSISATEAKWAYDAAIMSSTQIAPSKAITLSVGTPYTWEYSIGLPASAIGRPLTNRIKGWTIESTTLTFAVPYSPTHTTMTSYTNTNVAVTWNGTSSTTVTTSNWSTINSTSTGIASSITISANGYITVTSIARTTNGSYVSVTFNPILLTGSLMQYTPTGLIKTETSNVMSDVYAWFQDPTTVSLHNGTTPIIRVSRVDNSGEWINYISFFDSSGTLISENDYDSSHSAYTWIRSYIS